MQKLLKLLLIAALTGWLFGCARMDQPIHPKYEIGEPYCVIREKAQPVFDVSQAIGKLFTRPSIEAFWRRFQ